MSQGKKLLLAGGGYADIPLIKAAQKQGFYVITSGNRPDDPGHKISNEYCAEDFSNPEAMLELSKQLNIDAICACCNDFSAISAAYVAEKLSLPGHDTFETSQLIHHKDRYRKFAQDNDIPTPKAESFSDIKSAIRAIEAFVFPVMVKPVDLTGGKGIVNANTALDAKSAIENAFAISKSKRIVIEEYITGSNHGLSAFICNGKVVFHFVDNEYYYLNKYMVSAASTPANVPRKAITDLIQQAEKIAGLLKLKDGIFHIQYILRQNGDPVIIEICRRAPGDLYIKLVEHATGLNYPDWIIKAATGQDLSRLSQVEPKGFFTRHCIMADRSGVVECINFDPSIQNNIIDQHLWGKSGDKIDDYFIQKLGIIFLKFSNMDEMLSKTHNMQELIKVTMLPALK